MIANNRSKIEFRFDWEIALCAARVNTAKYRCVCIYVYIYTRFGSSADLYEYIISRYTGAQTYLTPLAGFNILLKEQLLDLGQSLCCSPIPISGLPAPCALLCNTPIHRRSKSFDKKLIAFDAVARSSVSSSPADAVQSPLIYLDFVTLRAISEELPISKYINYIPGRKI